MYYVLQVEKRVGDAVFTISDLCSLIRVLSVGARGDVAVTENVWIHLGSRYKEIDAANIADVYRVMRYIIPKAQYLWRVIERQLQVPHHANTTVLTDSHTISFQAVTFSVNSNLPLQAMKQCIVGHLNF